MQFHREMHPFNAKSTMPSDEKQNEVIQSDIPCTFEIILP